MEGIRIDFPVGENKTDQIPEDMLPVGVVGIPVGGSEPAKIFSGQCSAVLPIMIPEPPPMNLIW